MQLINVLRRPRYKGTYLSRSRTISTNVPLIYIFPFLDLLLFLCWSFISIFIICYICPLAWRQPTLYRLARPAAYGNFTVLVYENKGPKWQNGEMEEKNKKKNPKKTLAPEQPKIIITLSFLFFVPWACTARMGRYNICGLFLSHWTGACGAVECTYKQIFSCK